MLEKDEKKVLERARNDGKRMVLERGLLMSVRNVEGVKKR